MKTKLWFGLSLLTCSLFSYSYDLNQLQMHVDKQQYRLLQQAVAALPETPKDAKLLELQAQAMISLQQDEDLADILQQALADFPQHAELYFLAGISQFNLAQSSSIFSAPGYAKQGLSYFKQAAALAPTNPKYQRGLIDFYASAPGIVGGDEKEAQRLADALQTMDVVQGTLAQAALLRRNEKPAAAMALVKKLLEQQPANTDLLEGYATLLSSDKKPAEAFVLFQQTIGLYKTEVEKYDSLYQLGRLAAVEGQDLTVGKQALEQYIAYFTNSDNPSYPWARIRLAQIHLKEQNKTAAEQVLAPLLAKKPKEEKLQHELKTLTKALTHLKS